MVKKKGLFTAQGLMEMPFRAMYGTGKFLLERQVLATETGAVFSRPKDYKHYLNARNNGLLINGDNLSISPNDSFQHMCLVASTGAGKTTQFVVPNILNKAREKSSLVVNDPSGEIYSQTSQYMADNGYEILVINPNDLGHTSYFNPLHELDSMIELEQIADIIVSTGGSTNTSDPFWQDSSKRFITVLLKLLLNGSDARHFTLANLYYLLQNFGDKGAGLNNFVFAHAETPGRPNDTALLSEWSSVLIGNEKTIAGVVMNALTSLRQLGLENIAKITSKSTFRLEQIRKRKTIIYFIVPSQHSEFFAFFTSLFFQSVFNMSMRGLERGDLPLYVLYDEFGHSTLPNFVNTANTIRKFNVSLSIILQSMSQLNVRYGDHQAKAILGGFNNYMTLSGSDPATTQFFENIIGKIRRESRDGLFDPKRQFSERNLINSDEIRRIQQQEAIFLSKNNQPVKLAMTPFYQNSRFIKEVKRGAYTLPNNGENVQLQYVPLG